MKKLYITALALSIASGAFAQSKLNTEGLMLLDLYSEGRLPADMEAQFQGPVSRSSAPLVDVIVETTSEEVLDGLSAKGYEITYISPSFSIVTMPLDEVRQLEQIDQIKSLSLGSKAEPLMDVARGASRVNTCHTGLGISFQGESRRPFKGDGVIVGMYDTGFDPSHINFYNDDQTESRLKYYARFNGSNSTSPSVYTGSNTASAPTDNSDQTHGTHVAGIMGGAYNGSGTYYTLQNLKPTNIETIPLYGVAPHADLAISAGQLYDANILAGIRRIIEYAYGQGKPAVINLSLGSNIGPHDGTGSTVRALDELAREAIICVAAGNEGADLIHAGKTFTAASKELKVLLNNSGGPNGVINGRIDSWSSKSDAYVMSLLVINSTSGAIEAQVDSEPGKTVTVNATTCPLFANNYNGTISITSNLSAINRRYNVQARASNVYAKGTSRGKYNLGLMISGPEGTRVDIYSNEDAPFASTFLSGYDAPDNNGSVSDMSCGYNTIIVGSYNTRNTWYTHTGRQEGYQTGTMPVGQISSFSSWGDLIDGRSLPHITAPGAGILSSYSGPYMRSHTAETTGASATYMDGNRNVHYWAVMQGTSMACPYVTGVVALWLEANPKLKAEEARKIMMETAIKDNVTDSHAWGAGKINAAEGLKKVIANATEGGVNDITVGEQNIIVLPVDNRTFSIMTNSGSGIEATLYNISGMAVASVSTEGNDATISAESAPAGVYILKVRTGSETKTMKLSIR